MRGIIPFTQEGVRSAMGERLEHHVFPCTNEVRSRRKSIEAKENASGNANAQALRHHRRGEHLS